MVLNRADLRGGKFSDRHLGFFTLLESMHHMIG